jgi:hypothetical protein
MQSAELQPEIVSRQIQLNSLKGRFDEALNHNVELFAAKKLFRDQNKTRNFLTRSYQRIISFRI